MIQPSNWRGSSSHRWTNGNNGSHDERPGIRPSSVTGRFGGTKGVCRASKRAQEKDLKGDVSMRTSLRHALCLLAIVVGTAGPSHAYYGAILTLSKIIRDAGNIAVIE